MSFLDGGKPEPEWEEWMDDPPSRKAGWSCFGWVLMVVGSGILIFAIVFVIQFYRYLQLLPGG